MRAMLLTSASVGALILATGAQAADLARPVYKAPPARLPAWTWTGFYVGGTVGAVVGNDRVSNDPASPVQWLVSPINTNSVGIIGGLEAGYNWQVSQIVLGIEGDVSVSSLKQSANGTSLGATTPTFSSRLNTLSTIRGRLGWAFDRTLLYGTGGVAFANLKDQLIDPAFPFTDRTGSSVTGWTAGLGVEYAFTDHWTAKAEYLHVGFSQRAATTNVAGYIFDYRDRLDIGRVGINYKF
ncbi:MAG TPA: outer membrane beta-barrel protein [Micropepsaceae bacterium]|nr:outer membrane beta-barrel protein [Micropepsaceae bacterium]